MTDPNDIIVLATRTSMSPAPDATHYYAPPGLFPPADVRRVLVSCTFSWARQRAEWLALQWCERYPEADVLVGGPAYGDPGAEFVPGRFLRDGVTITTRGCPGCPSPGLVPEREGKLRLLPIMPGNNVLDNNLLAAPREHVEAVLDMLEEQPRAAIFSGGLDARHMRWPQQQWLIERLTTMRVKEFWLAYDSAEDQAPVIGAIHRLRSLGMRRRQIRCYVLVGRPFDTLAAATERCRWVLKAGGLPFAMLWRPTTASQRFNPAWSEFMRAWTRPGLILNATRMKEDGNE